MNGMRTERGQEAAGATREEPRYLPGVRTGRRGRGSGGTGPAARRRVRCRGVARHRRWPPARQLRENVRRGGCPGRRASCEDTCGISRSDIRPGPPRAPGARPASPSQALQSARRTPTGARGAFRSPRNRSSMGLALGARGGPGGGRREDPLRRNTGERRRVLRRAAFLPEGADVCRGAQRGSQ